MTFPDRGYAPLVIPDDTAGPPLTPVEKAAIADLERRFLLAAAAPNRDHVLFARPTRLRRVRSGWTAAVPLVALFVTAVLLVVVAVVTGIGPLGVAAVVVSAVATGVLWTLLPARYGGPARGRRRPLRVHRAGRRPKPA